MKARTLALALILAPALVGAEPPKQTIPRHAKQLAAKGRAAHEAGAYGDAILAYREAYGIAPSPSLLFNLAQAYRLAGNCHAAVQMYRRFIAEQPEAQVRSLAETHLADVERCASRPNHARVAVAPQGLLPGSDPTTFVDTAEPTPSPGRTRRRVGVAMMVTGAVAVGFAGYYAFDARDASLTVENAYARGVQWHQVKDIAANGERSATIAKTLGIGGGIAIASGITLYVLGKRAERVAPVALVPTRGGAEVSWAWRF